MSLSFANAVVEGLRSYGVTVRFWPGWEARGNGQVSNYQGLELHHTGSNYGKAYATLVNGRSDLSGPLCNSSGDDDGGVTIIAANPANHAGASGGRAMGPLPTTGSFNKLMWGHEIVYPGTKPMTAAQYRTALILAAVISKILKRPNTDWVRGHAETSITGKWDPGFASGKTIDLNKLRAEAKPLMAPVQGPVPAPKKKDNTVNNFPVTGVGALRLICPTGKASTTTARAWVNAVVNGVRRGWVKVFYQTDTGGIRDKEVFINFKDGRSDRFVDELPDGTTQINIQYSFPDGGTICLETLGK